MNRTDRLGLPLLAAGQAQKELAHNEALALIDMATGMSVESMDLAAPPSAPAAGACWIVASGASGDWAGHAGEIAGWSAAGWLFLAPREGQAAWIVDRGHAARFDGTLWQDEPARADGYYVAGVQVVAARQAAIAAPSGGATQDAQARDTIAAILNALQAHGLIAP